LWKDISLYWQSRRWNALKVATGMQEGESDSDKLLPRRYATAAGNVVYPQRNTEFNPGQMPFCHIHMCSKL